MLALLVLIAGTHLVALAIPGPDFFLVSQVAASHSKAAALKATLGIAAGVFFWAAIALFGLNILLTQMAWLQTGIMFAGGAYLCYLAYSLLCSAFMKKVSGSVDSETPAIYVLQQHFLLKGLLTNLSNPKAVIYFGSVFSAFIGKMEGGEFKWIVLSVIVIETILWFSLVATVFSLPHIQKMYQRFAKWVDGVAGALFWGFGLYLIYSSFRNQHG